MNTMLRTALVTGASRGLGYELARSLARRGVRVAMVARHADELARAAAEVQKEGEACAFVADVSQKEETLALAARAHAALGEIDALVHNASALGPTPLGLLLDTACEDFEAVFAANVLGPFRLSKAVLGPMLLRGRGLVVHVSSDAAVNAYPRWGAYGVSKAACDHLARTWDAELAGSDVRVIAVDPGEMDTAMHAAALPEADRAALARPADVAARLAALLFRAHALPNGARVELPSFDLDTLPVRS